MLRYRTFYSGLLLTIFVLTGSLTSFVSNVLAITAPVDLATSGHFAILAGSAVTGTATNVVTGDAGLSSTTGAAITLLTCSEMTGASKIYDVDGTYVGGGNPDVSCLLTDAGALATAKSDLVAAYTDAAGRPVDSTISTDLGGQTLTTGVYNSADTTFTNSGTLTLDAEGDSTRVFIFIAGSTLITSSSSHVVLANGAKASNVFWVVGSSATLGSSSDLMGTIMAVTSITVNTSTIVHGRLLADADNNTAGAVTLDGGNTITLDTTAPTSVVTSPGDSTYSTSTTVALTGTSADTYLSSTTISVDGGAFVATGGTAAAWTYSAVGLSQGAHTFQSKATDTSGNTGLSSLIHVTVDTISPSVVIGSDTATLKKSQTAAITFTLSESATDFDATDVTVAGGILSAFAGSGTSYTATFTPTDNSTTLATVDVAVSKFNDAAGNDNTAALQLSMTVDTIAPSVVITTDQIVAINIASGNPTYTFTFSEPVTGFAVGDIVVGHGTKSTFTPVSGTVYTLVVIPTAFEGNQTVDVAGDVAIDAAGNGNTVATQLAWTMDTVAPTITIGSDTATLNKGQTAAITFTLSESASDFISGDVTVAGGALSAFAGSGTSYTATFTPTDNSTTTATIDVSATKFTDAAGNNNTISNHISMTVDTIAPTITIGSDTATLNKGQTAAITFTLSESATDFDATDVAVAGGILSAFAGSGTSYTGTFTPTDDSVADGTIDVAINKFTDAAGNNNTISNHVSMSVDTIRPTVDISLDKYAFIVGDTAVVTFNFSEAVTGFTNTDVGITNGTFGASVASLDGGITWTATFTPTNDLEDSSNAISVDVTGVLDLAGNAGVGTAGSLNYAIDTRPPTITIGSDTATLNKGQTAAITFTLSESSSNFDATDVTVAGGILSAFAGSGTSYSATFTPTDESTTTATVDVAATKFTDAAGNNNTISNHISMTVDTIAPTMTIGSDTATLNKGQTAAITFTLSESSSNFDATDVTVAGGILSAFVGSGTSYSATFTPTDDSTTTATVDVAVTKFTDAAGNDNTISNHVSMTVDTIAPTITITDDVVGTVTSGEVNYTFTFSENVTGFDVTDISVSGGSIGAFAGSGSVYTLVVTPNASSTTNILVNVAGSVAPDAAGNSNTVAVESVQSVNTVVVSSGGGSSRGHGYYVSPTVPTVPVSVPVTLPPSTVIPSDICATLSFDIYIINPDGSERHSGTPWVVVTDLGSGIKRYAFEDKTLDLADPAFDHNDSVIDVDQTDCQQIKFIFVSSDALWKHQVRVRVTIDGVNQADILVAENSKEVVGTAKAVDVIEGVVTPLGVVLPAPVSLKGKILLQVQQHGEAWYVHPVTGLRYYMKDGSMAYDLMSSFGLGITDANLAMIPSVASIDALHASTSVCESNSLANTLKGTILLQVQQHGEAWYVDVDTCRRIYMKDGDMAYSIMRYLGLGITDADLAKITIG